MDGDESIDIVVEDTVIAVHEIPLDYLESPPPESLSSLDEQLKKLLNDIKKLDDERRDAMLQSDKSFPTPLFPFPSFLESFNDFRDKQLEEFLNVPEPASVASIGDDVKKEMREFWDIDSEVTGEKILYRLLAFYKDRASALLVENSLIVSRYTRFQHISQRESELFDVIRSRQQRLQDEYQDATERWERLMKISQEGPKEANQKDSQFDFELSDLAIYLRWFIQQAHAQRDLKTFFTRMKIMPHYSFPSILGDYHLINEIKPGEGKPDFFGILEGINEFVESMPLKQCAPEDFLTEAELLCSYWKIESPIDLEDGQPFIYEAESLFYNRFQDQVQQNILAPYEGLSDKPAGDRGAATSNDYSDLWTEKMASFAEYSVLPDKKKTRIRKADWIDKVKFYPRYQKWQKDQINTLGEQVETDLEVKYEYNLLMVDDYEVVVSQLKGSAKRLYSSASQVPNCRPISGKILSMNKEHSRQPLAEPEIHFYETFNLGMCVPNGKLDLIDSNVLLSKKLLLGQLLKDNEEIQKLDAQSKSFNSHKINPTIATLFTENEIYALLLLRNIRLREQRDTLLRQLNFFRSVEKRLTLDFDNRSSAIKIQEFDADRELSEDLIPDFIVSMMQNRSLFNLTKSLDFDANAENDQRPPDLSCEDLRGVVGNMPIVFDAEGNQFIYDVALTDRAEIENTLIKASTIYLNKDIIAGDVGKSYVDELRYRMSDRKTFSETIISNSTHMNSSIDRSQFLLELFTAEVEFNFAKMDLVNAYMEIYEQSSDSQEIRQILIDLLYLRPNYNFNNRNIIQSYVIHRKSLELHAIIVKKMIKYGIDSHRNWISSISSGKIKYDGMINFGIPEMYKAPEATLHIPEIEVGMTQIVPQVSQISNFFDVLLKTRDQFIHSVSNFTQVNYVSPAAMECAVLKEIIHLWDLMADLKFSGTGTAPTRRYSVNLSGPGLIDTPYLPDFILRELNSEMLIRNNSNATFNYTDHDLKTKGTEKMMNLYKFLIIRSRLLFSWTETEYWRKALQEQCDEMNLSKEMFSGRLYGFTFDLSEHEPVLNDDAFHEASYDLEDLTSAAQADQKSLDSSLKFGPLVISELEENYQIINLDDPSQILHYMEPVGLKRLILALRLQLPEKNLLMAVSEIITSLLAENRSKILLEDLNKRLYPTMSYSKKNKQPKEENFTSIAELSSLIPNIVQKKTSLRKTTMLLYTKEYKLIRDTKISQGEKTKKINELKNRIVLWYNDNLSCIAKEGCEKAQFVKIMATMKKTIFSDSYGSISFLESKIRTNNEFFLYENQSEKGNIEIKKPLCRKQELYFYHDDHLVQLAHLWYIPHTAECISKLGQMDTNSLDITKMLFVDLGIFGKSYEIHALIFQIYNLVKAYSKLLQSSQRISSHVKSLREADYVINNIENLKREIGEKAEYSKIRQLLLLKRKQWYLKLYLMLSLSINSLKMTLMHDAAGSLKLSLMELNPHEINISINQLGFFKDIHVRLPDFYDTNLYIYGGLDHYAKRICDSNVLNLEETLEERLQALSFENMGTSEEINQILVNYLSGFCVLVNLRQDFFESNSRHHSIKNTEEVKYLSDRYKFRIVVPAIKFYYDQTRGNQTVSANTFLEMDFVQGPNSKSNISKRMKQSFEECQIKALKIEFLRKKTSEMIDTARYFYHKLEDERMGRLFKTKNSILVPSSAFINQLAFNIADEDYLAKSTIFHELSSAIRNLNTRFNFEDYKTHIGAEIRENIFACEKEKLAAVLYDFSMRLTKWQTTRQNQAIEFDGKMHGHLLGMLRNSEHIIRYLNYLKNCMEREFKASISVQTKTANLDILSELASASTELEELKKSRKIDEKRIRAKIIDEYDDLVQELVNEITVLRNRFREYQTNNFNQVMQIMSESKKSELFKLSIIDNIPDSVHDTAVKMISEENQIMDLRKETHELQMTLLKIRSMFTMKEQALRTQYDRQILELTTKKKDAEDRLWRAYKDREARERAQRRELHKLEKTSATSQTQIDTLQRLLKEAQTKIQPLISSERKKDGNQKAVINHSSLDASSFGEWTGDPKKDELIFYQIKEKLKFYEKIQIQNLLEELKNKTYLIETLIQQKRDEETKKDSIQKPSKLCRPSSVRKPDLRWNIKVRNDLDQSNAAASAEPSSKTEYELNRLTSINQQLIQLLQKNSIPIPNDILSSDKQRVSFAVTAAPASVKSQLYSRPQSGIESVTTLPYVIPVLSRASSARKDRGSRPESGLSGTMIGTSIAGSNSRPCTARQISRPGTSSAKRPASARFSQIAGLNYN